MTAIRFEVLPVFSKLSFADNADLKEALDYILQFKKKEDPDNQIFNILKKAANTIGDLRRFSDHEWLKLEIPAICRIYLKHLVRQAERRTTPGGRTPAGGGSEDRGWAQLETEFNGGQPFDMGPYQSSLKQLMEMSFTRVEAMEALLITNNLSLEAALEVLVMDPVDKAARRAATIAKGGSRNGGKEAALSEQLLNLQRQHDREKAIRAKLEEDLKTQKARASRDLYKGYLKGLISTEIISVTDQEKMKKLREDLNFGDREQLEILAELGVSPEEFDKLKSDEQRKEKECVVCLDRPRTHVIFDCMHLCLCEECTLQIPSKKCPICTKKVISVKRVFF